MHCREFEQRLQSLLDERKAPERDPRLRDHAARCERCRQLFADQAVLLTGLSRRAAPQPRPDFARRAVLTATAPTQRRHQARRAWLAGATALASAAAMLLAVSLAWYARFSGRDVVAGPGPSPRAF